MKKFALLLLTALLALPASLYAQEPSITQEDSIIIEWNTTGVYGWTHKLTVNPGTANEYVIYTRWNEIVNGAEFMPGYRDQFTGKDIVLPFRFKYDDNNYALRKIGMEAFKSCLMNSVTIPEGVEEIEWMSFEDCDSLTTVHIPESVTSIATNAFGKCDNLESFTGKFVDEDGRSVVVPGRYEYEEGKYYLASVALKGLTSYTIPSYVTDIYAYFDGAWDLKEVIIPEGVKGTVNSWNSTHGEYAVFENCGITSLRIPDSLKPNNALVRNCPYLTKFEGKWASEDGRFLMIPCENGDEYYELTDSDYAEIEAAIDSGYITREEVLEKPRAFDPRGRVSLTPRAKNR